MYKAIKNSSIVTILTLSLYACNSSDTEKGDKIIISKSIKVQNIEIIENDSMKSIVIVKDGKVESMNKYKNGKLNGEQLKFYDNGLLSKKINTSNGITEGNKYEFYPSGSILSYNFYCQIYPCYFGVEYWDNPLNTLKKSVHYGKQGEIEKIKLFDTLGYFIKDSVSN